MTCSFYSANMSCGQPFLWLFRTQDPERPGSQNQHFAAQWGRPHNKAQQTSATCPWHGIYAHRILC